MSEEQAVPQKVVCQYCGSVAPYGDARNSWIGAHQHRLRRFIARLKHNEVS